MSLASKFTIIFSLLAYILVNAMPSKLKCEIAEKFLNKGFNQNQIRFSVCYAEIRNFSSLAYYQEHYDEPLIFYGLFPITIPWCATANISVENSICKTDCNRMLDNDIEDDVMCIKEIFNANLTGAFLNYMNAEKRYFQKCMTTVLDECCFSGPGGQTKDCQPIFNG